MNTAVAPVTAPPLARLAGCADSGGGTPSVAVSAAYRTPRTGCERGRIGIVGGTGLADR
ncbi:hypothetical protein [Nocardia sp. NPDC052566]|uniref:hypothetical protein n=1 Tax=Nocardia sp. NPDC052566 TaxID=3364330 RepID=UPI0037C9F96F